MLASSGIKCELARPRRLTMTWQKLADILRQDRQEEQDWLDEMPTVCPNDGTPLETGPAGQLHCPMGDWTRPSGTTNRFA